MRNKALKCFLIGISLSIVGCSMSPEDAKQELKDHGYSMSSESLRKAVKVHDYEALKWYSIAGLDGSRIDRGLDIALSENVLDAKATELLVNTQAVDEWAKSSMKSDIHDSAYANMNYQRGSVSAAIFRNMYNLVWRAASFYESGENDKYEKSIAVLNVFLNKGILPHDSVLGAASSNLRLFKKLFGLVEGSIQSNTLWSMAAMRGNEGVLNYVTEKKGSIPNEIAINLFANPNAGVLRVLKKAGFQPSAQVMGHAIQQASYSNNIEVLDALLDFNTPISKEIANRLMSSLCQNSQNARKYSNDVITNYVAKLVKSGAEINKPIVGGGSTPLSYASIGSNKVLVQALLKNGSKLNIGEEYSYPLNRAFGNMRVISSLEEVSSKFAVIRMLVDAGAIPTDRTQKYDYIFSVMTAPISLVGINKELEKDKSEIKKLSIELTQDLFDKWNVDVNGRGSFDLTPLMVASIAGDTELIRWLLEQKADVTAIRHNSGYQKPPSIVLMNNQLENIVNSGGLTALHFAVISRHPESAKELIRHGDASDKQTKVALLWAILYGDDGTVDELLKAGVSPDVRDGNGNTALMIASAHGLETISKLLISKGADINAVRSKGVVGVPRIDVGNTGWSEEWAWSPITLALANIGKSDRKEACRKLVLELLDEGADVSTAPPKHLFKHYYQNFRVLRLAWDNDRTLIPILLKHGASPNVDGDNNHEIIYLASALGDSELVDELLAYGANPNSLSKTSWGVGLYNIDTATDNGHLDTVKILLEYGAKVTKRSLAIARQKGYTDIFELLKTPPTQVKKVGWKKNN